MMTALFHALPLLCFAMGRVSVLQYLYSLFETLLLSSSRTGLAREKWKCFTFPAKTIDKNKNN